MANSLKSILIVAVILVGLTTVSLTRPQPANAATPTLLFLDGFNGTSLDTSKWNTCYGWTNGWPLCTNAGNPELEWYQAQNNVVSNGTLKQVARSEPTVGTDGKTYPYTSGLISTQGKFSFKYGYLEIKAKTPAGAGLWPTFWTLPVDGTWPPELDVMEQKGQFPNINYMTVHFYKNGNFAYSSKTYTGPDFTAGMHIYGLDWQPRRLNWYVDGVLRASFGNRSLIPSKAMYIICNLAVGGDGSFAGPPNSSTVFPAKLEVDYIKVYSSKP